MNIEQLLTQSWDDFVLKINALMDELGISRNKFACDHAAIRVNSTAQADLLRVFFKQYGKVISANIINGRPILIIELEKPLMLNQTPVQYIELPYPSDKTYPAEGWEHIELIIPGEAKSIEQLKLHTITFVPKMKSVINEASKDIKIKYSSPKGEKERIPNPTIAIKQNGICIKLHSFSIKAIIDSEQG